ncbi:hypothetical protein F511_10659 [Dorcoceras hygrometricum]|uniref:Uncharacterized protein n=1 Tax=Dorcoceras hygrometricum TaxID=472368 RepID=A0A2Z7CMM8_9LAMI|nr:hypothetical protein F511_10659 [Dorcoceras hygrometricum]
MTTTRSETEWEAFERPLIKSRENLNRVQEAMNAMTGKLVSVNESLSEMRRGWKNRWRVRPKEEDRGGDCEGLLLAMRRIEILAVDDMDPVGQHLASMDLARSREEEALLSTKTGGPKHSVEGIEAARFSNSGSVLAALKSDPNQQEILLYGVHTCQLDMMLSDTSNTHSGRGHAYSLVHFSPSDSVLLWNGVLWDRRSSSPMHRFDQFTDHGGGCFHPAGNEVINNPEAWDLRNRRLLRSVSSWDQTVITFNASGDVIYATLRRNLEDVNSIYNTGRVKHPLLSAFRTVDAVNYFDIATVPVDRCVLDFATEPTDSLLGLITMNDQDEMYSSARDLDGDGTTCMAVINVNEMVVSAAFLHDCQRELYPLLLLFPAERKKDPVPYEGDIAVTDIITFLAGHGSRVLDLILDKSYQQVHTSAKKVPQEESSPHEVLVDGRLQDRELKKMNSRFPIGLHERPQLSIGCILSATEKLLDIHPFDESKILVVKVEQRTGFQGLIINKRISWDSLEEEGFDLLKEAPLSFGGPVLRRGLPLVALTHKLIENQSVEILPEVYFVDPWFTQSIIEEIRVGNQSVQDYWFFYGYSSWGWDQLFHEIAQGAWNIKDVSSEQLELPWT